MGYALFANRKLLYTHQLFTLQTKLDAIQRQKMQLLNFTSNISDGVVTIEEMAEDANNYFFYKDFLATCDANQANDESVKAVGQEIINIAATKGYTDEQLETFRSMISIASNESVAQTYSKQLAAQEEKLDLQQQKIQTQISAIEKQLEQVEQAEAKAIQRATPKYNGVG